MDAWKEEQLDKLIRDVTGGIPETSESLWDNFEKSFVEAFTNTNAKREAYDQLLGLKQEDNLDTFIAQFRLLVRQADINPDDHGCIELLKQGLKLELLVAIIQSPAFDPQQQWTFNQWAEAAQKQNTKRKLAQQYATKSNGHVQLYTIPALRGHQTQAHHAPCKPTYRQDAMDIDVTHAVQVNATRMGIYVDRRDRPKEPPKKCDFCQNLGHTRQECRKKKRYDRNTRKKANHDRNDNQIRAIDTRTRQAPSTAPVKRVPSTEDIIVYLRDHVQTLTEATRTDLADKLLPICPENQRTQLIRALHLNGVFIPKKNAVNIPITFTNGKGTETETALLDSGATENFIDLATTQRLGLGTKTLDKPRPAFKVDGTLNRNGTITHACDLLVSRSNQKERQQFYITNLGRDRLILGYPWFKAFKPDIDWPNAKLKGPKVHMETLLYGKFKQLRQYIDGRTQHNGNTAMEIDTTETTEEQTEPVEINKANTAVDMAHKYMEEHGKKEITLPDEFK